MKFYQKRGFALVVLILAIIGSGVYGISKKPALAQELVGHLGDGVLGSGGLTAVLHAQRQHHLTLPQGDGVHQ